MDTLREPNLMYHRDKVVDSYLSSLPEAEQETAAYFADALYRVDTPLARTVVIIPVAAHQEKETIGHALDEYSKQQTSTPFTIMLGLNTVFGNDKEAEVIACQDEMYAAMRRHPQLDVRPVFYEYVEPTIGEIRRDLWNGALLAAQREELVAGQNDVIGINHDIDLVSLPRHYIASVQKAMSNSIRNVAPAHTQIRHASDPRFPHLSTAVRWIDHLGSLGEIGYEAGAVIPFSFYAKQGGFNGGAATYEVNSLTSGHARKRLLRTGALQTSPRRYIARLPYYGLDNIWSEDSFGANDRCRNPEYISELRDIDHDALVATISIVTSRNLPHIVEGAPMSPFHKWCADEFIKGRHNDALAEERLFHIFHTRRRLVSRALGATLSLPEHAQRVEKGQYSDDQLRKLAKKRMYDDSK